MTDALAAPAPPKPARLFEFDLLKTFLIFAMVSSHSLEEIFSRQYADFAFCAHTAFSVAIEDFLFLPGPLGFMAAMGALMVLAAPRPPAQWIRRGIVLLLVWLLLNVLRALPPALLASGGDRAAFQTWLFTFVFVNDILFFAGLFFLFAGFLRRLGATTAGVLAVSSLLYGASLFVGDIGPAVPAALHPVLAGFIHAGSLSVFPFLSWAIIPALGMAFGELLARSRERRTSLYVAIACLSAALLAALLPALRANGLLDGEALLEMRGNPIGLHANGPLPLACSIGFFGLLLSACHFLAPLLRRGRVGAAITYLGSRLPLIYVVQWVLIPLVALALRGRLAPLPVWALALSCLAIAAASAAIAEACARLWRRLHA